MLNAIKKSINMKNLKALFAKYGNKKKKREKAILSLLGIKWCLTTLFMQNIALSPWLTYIYSSTLGRNKKLLTFGLNW